MNAERGNERNWDQVRDRIDAGGTEDKVAVPEPAAAPLGADEEAGGARTPPEAIARSEAAQSGARPQTTSRRARRAASPAAGRAGSWLA